MIERLYHVGFDTAQSSRYPSRYIQRVHDSCQNTPNVHDDSVSYSKRPRCNTYREVSHTYSDSQCCVQWHVCARPFIHVWKSCHAPRRTKQDSISFVLQQIQGITLPKQQCLQLRPSLLISPMLTKHVSKVDSSGNMNEPEGLGGNRLQDCMPRQRNMPLVQLSSCRASLPGGRTVELFIFFITPPRGPWCLCHGVYVN